MMKALRNRPRVDLLKVFQSDSNLVLFLIDIDDERLVERKGVDLLKVFQSDSVRAPSRIPSRMCLIPLFLFSISRIQTEKMDNSSETDIALWGCN